MKRPGQRVRETLKQRKEAVVDTARLVLLGWFGNSVDGGRAMQEALLVLKRAFDALEPEFGDRVDEKARSETAGAMLRAAYRAYLRWQVSPDASWDTFLSWVDDEGGVGVGGKREPWTTAHRK
jgi:hypothetical protein